MMLRNSLCFQSVFQLDNWLYLDGAFLLLVHPWIKIVQRLEKIIWLTWAIHKSLGLNSAKEENLHFLFSQRAVQQKCNERLFFFDAQVSTTMNDVRLFRPETQVRTLENKQRSNKLGSYGQSSFLP